MNGRPQKLVLIVLTRYVQRGNGLSRDAQKVLPVATDIQSC